MIHFDLNELFVYINIRIEGCSSSSLFLYSIIAKPIVAIAFCAQEIEGEFHTHLDYVVTFPSITTAEAEKIPPFP